MGHKPTKAANRNIQRGRAPTATQADVATLKGIAKPGHTGGLDHHKGGAPRRKGAR